MPRKTRRRGVRKSRKPRLRGGTLAEDAQVLLDYTSGEDPKRPEQLESLMVPAKNPFVLWRGVRYNPFKDSSEIVIDRVTSCSISPLESIEFMWESFRFEANQVMFKLMIPAGFPYIPVERTIQMHLGRAGWYPTQQEFVLLPTYKRQKLHFKKVAEYSGKDVTDYAMNSAVESWFRRHPEKFKYKDGFKHDFRLIVIEPSYR